MSSETGDPLGFASVGFFLQGAAPGTPEAKPKSVVGKGDGTYRVPLAPGMYRAEVQFISYQTLKVTDIEIKAGEFVTLDLALTPSAIQLETVEVTAQEVRNSEAAILSKRKKAVASSDGISAEQIKKTADGNAAEVATRVTGVSVVGDRYVYIRGLGERYNSTLLNGATIATPEPERRVVPLDLFPSDLVDNLVVQKAYTPDLPGEFAGGAVDINTREFPGKRSYSFSVTSGYNAGTTGQDYRTYEGGSRDFLGIDDGTRALPEVIATKAENEAVYFNDSVTGRPGGFDSPTIIEMSQAFTNEWEPQNEDGSPSFGFSATYADQAQVFERDLGVFAGASLKNDFTTYDFDKNVYESVDDAGLLTSTATYTGEVSASEVLWGSLLHTSYRLNDANTISLRGMYDRTSEDEVRVYQGYEGDTQQRDIRDTRFLFVERGLFTGAVETEHHLKDIHNSRLQLRGSYSQTERDEPDRREYVYEYNPVIFENENFEEDTTYTWQLTRTPSDRGFTRFYSELDDIERNVDATWTIPFNIGKGLESKAKSGFAVKNKNRDYGLRRFAFIAPNMGIDLSQAPEVLMADENMGTTNSTFRLEEVTRDTDNYLGSQDLLAGFLMFDVPVTSRFRAVAGARIEMSDQEVLTRDVLYKSSPDQISELETTDVLPSLNLTYALTNDLNLRGSYFKTLARPELRELSPFSIANYQGDFETIGNPDLERSLIYNYDLRAEYFPGANEVLAVSAFYKDLDKPIEMSVQGGSSPKYMPVNGGGGYVRGVELEARLGLGRATSALDRFGMNMNLTLVQSETKISQDFGIQYSNERPLEGQSPYVANVGLSYSSERDRTQVGLLYNVFGERIRYVGFGTLPDIYEQPRHNLDLTASHGFGASRLKLAFENVLDTETLFRQGSQTTEVYSKGPSFSLSLSVGSQ